MKKLNIKIMLLAILLATSLSADYDDNKDHNYKHITLINQTSQYIKFVIENAQNISLHSHTAKYRTMNTCKSGFTVQFKHINKGLKIDEWIKNSNGNKLTVHRKCGENVYIWRDKNKKHYHVGKKPHVQADLPGKKLDKNRPAILFAHGYSDDQKTWGKYADRAIEKGWRVFRTSVSDKGSIKKRANMLADYMNKIRDVYDIKDGTLRVVGHSMGGLDIRYIVSNPNGKEKLTKASRLIEKIYTIATPHKGDGLASFVAFKDDGAKDLTPAHMSWFNSHNKYKDFKVDGKQIPLTALRFSCKGHTATDDGVVRTIDQTYSGAKISANIYRARHTKKVCLGTNVPKVELYKTTILDKILEDKISTKIAY